MGISLGLGTLLAGVVGAGASAASAHHTQAANASAQSQLNKETMAFNEKEAGKARDWQAAQAVIDRQFNSAEALKQRQFAANESALSRQFESQEASVARNFDAQQALLARQFEERMSSSAHQREVQDLKLAGLNPILSATGGSGASTPSAPVIGAPLPSSSIGQGVSASHSSSGGSAAHVSGLNAYMKKDVIGEFVNSALESMRVSNDLKKAQAADKAAEAQQLHAKAHQLEAETGVKRQAAEEKRIDKEIEKIDSDITIAFEDLDIRKQLKDADIEKTHAVIDELYSKIGVNQSMANKLNMETHELKRKIKYGAFLATYLPDEPAEWIYSKLGTLVKNNPAFDDFVTKYSSAMSLDEKRELALNSFELIKKYYEGSD